MVHASPATLSIDCKLHQGMRNNYTRVSGGVIFIRSGSPASPYEIHRKDRNAYVIEKGATMAENKDTAGTDANPTNGSEVSAQAETVPLNDSVPPLHSAYQYSGTPQAPEAPVVPNAPAVPQNLGVVRGPVASQNPAAPQSPVASQSAVTPQSSAAPQNPVASQNPAASQFGAPQGQSPYAPAGHGQAPQAYAPHQSQAQSHTPTQAQAPTQSQTSGAVPPFGLGAEPVAAPTKEKRAFSTGTFIAGVAVAALLGGAIGGGVISSLVVANTDGKTSAVVQQGGTITLNNAETATAISGVALVATPSVVTLDVQTSSAAGSGSGVIYDDEGYIITNAHVVSLGGVESDPAIRVRLSDGRVFDGKVVGIAPYADIAVVKIEADNLTPIQVADSGDVNVGDLAVAIGAPMNLANTVTSGIVSALNRGISVGSPLIPQDPSQAPEQDNGQRFPWDFRFDTPDQRSDQDSEQSSQPVGQVTLPVIQTDASINPGNSGGALLNGMGELIGINVAIASPGATEGTASSAGLGFAIPSALATRIADEIIAGEQPSHGLLGASVSDSSGDTDADADHSGGLLQEVIPGGAAAKAGLKAGDVITAIDGVPAGDGTSVSALIRMHAGGSEISIDFTRNGKPNQVTATLGTLEW